VAHVQLSFAPARERVYKMSLPLIVKSLAGPTPDFRDAGQIGALWQGPS
jgi:hypothetical protein